LFELSIKLHSHLLFSRLRCRRRLLQLCRRPTFHWRSFITRFDQPFLNYLAKWHI